MAIRRNTENKVKFQPFYELFEEFLIYLKLRTYENAETSPCQQKITSNQEKKTTQFHKLGVKDIAEPI